jgi:hypothetical protein
MKFLCSNCKAKYQIADEKVAGRTLRMTCRRCQEEIVIRGEPVAINPSFVPPIDPTLSRMPPSPSPSPSPAPSPLGADFQMQVASNLRGMTPAPAIEEWHVAINDVPVGPIRREDVARKLAAGQIDGQSLAWREGMDDWAPINQIPELMRLSSAPPGPVAPPPLMPHAAMRAEAAYGGRGSATPYGMEPAWVTADERSSQVVINPSLIDQAAALRRSTPSWPTMFAVAGLFAFLMSGMAIFGAWWLRESSAESPPAAAAGAGGAAAPVQPTLELPEATPTDPEMVIGADDPALQNPRGTGTRPRATGSAAKPKKELTAAQKEMLARMGGDTGTDLSGLKTDTGAAPTRKVAGSLTSEDVSKVVLRGRKNLQRCYETAVRGSGSDETVRMDIELTVAASGNVANVTTSGGNLPGMAQCIQRTVKMWRFPQSAEASPVKFPLLFQPGA